MIEDSRTTSLVLNHYGIVSLVRMPIANYDVQVPQWSKAASSAVAETYQSSSSQTIASTLQRPALDSENHSYCVNVQLGFKKLEKLEEHGSTQRISTMANRVYGLFSSLSRFYYGPYNRSPCFRIFGRWMCFFEIAFSAVMPKNATLAAAHCVIHGGRFRTQQ